MPLLEQHTAPDYRWAIWKVTETLDELAALLPDQGAMYTEELEKFTSDSRKKEWLAVRVLLYTLTGRQQSILYHPSGKPYLQSPHSPSPATNCQFLSVSHTRGYVALITSPSYEVGIDIENISDRVHKVAHKFVHDDEIPPGVAPDTHTLLLIWSAKETLFKCLNETAVDFREHLRVTVPQPGDTKFTAREFRTPAQKTFTLRFSIHTDFALTWLIDN